ncbi:Dextransucrase [Apilactobacillus kunkeei]|uniref:glycoside hydrolase family 70 protein n=1 Tax=Apilactobacillus kunkeei TaxID=148814 RepID=UPI0006B25A7B|nr:glycoside hydrolase family 70 protein [Apilactobacillus kunkeei]KOY77446.1 Dextransucrase [Apilactobacillus kunkeei]
MNNNQEKKLHYKMYKSGKQWIVAGILSATMSVVFAEHVDNPTVSAKADQNNVTYTGSYASSNSDNGKSAYSASSYISGTGSLPDSAKSSIASSASSSNSVSFSASSLSSSSQTDTSSSSSKNYEQSVSSSSSSQNESSQASNSSESSSVSASSSQSSNASDSSAQSSFASVSLSVQLASNASESLKAHTKEIDGKTYFYDSNNNQVKSALIEDNDTYYYFGTNGYLTTFNSKFSDGSINSSDKLSIYTPDGKSITNIDGFLTANSWYRPKQIQVSDTQWRDSTNADFRPLLSVWWPNKTVEINYLNYMSKNGLVSGQFDSNSSANDINNAAATVRLNIENKIKADNGSLDEIKALFTTFVNSQDEWNINSEDYNSGDSLQGGALLYGNNSQTKDANSNYRLLNRNPTEQDGKVDYTHTTDPGFEFLLANDVDNSNPVVQAETLNWLHYLMNFGSIVKNDSSANFDGVRVDAVDNMDADVLNIISQYFRDAYKINANDVNSDNHLSILEDWSGNDPYYQKDHGTNQMTIDSGYLNSLRSILMYNPAVRSDMSTIINAGVVNRQDDNTTNQAIPNYEIVRAHDAGVQDIISQIIIDNIDPHASSSNPTWEQMREAFKIYDADEDSAVKKYTQYNIPASYALTLTNKDTTPRVYYGDMYTDGGQFMAQKTPYYDSIAEMLKSRVKYVAGGQHMEAVKVNNGEDTILTSVRYGKDALNADDLGDSLTRTSGIAVVESNNPTLTLSDKDKVVIHMGAAHKNQEYRQLLTASNSGIDTFDSDSSTGYEVVRTDDNGDLTLDGSTIKGYSTPQVSGYLSMWVPLGAADNQDIRTAPSSTPTTDGQSIHSNEASDSNVILEAFSNFQDFAQTPDQYENVVIQKNAEDFKNLGFTYLELPPQYRSTTDGSFIDSVVQNGYSFNDRYDLGFGTPTKYGTAEQLMDAIKALHAQGIKVLADIVPDQIYSLPNQQIVNATRTNAYGNADANSDLINSLYDAFSKGSGTDYQYKYGGEFLEQLQKLYPDLFTTKQISTGQPIDASKKLKVWTAEYLNGSNIQGRGAGYVLSSTPDSNYFTVTDDGNTNIKTSNLPNELLGNNVEYGLKVIDGKSKYVSTSGYIAKNTFIQDDNGNWYYVDNDGDFATSPQVINGNKYFFLSNGVNLRDFVAVNSDGTMNYYQNNGYMAQTSAYYFSKNINQMLHVNDNGTLDTGIVDIHGNTQYFDENGYQIKGDIVNFNGTSMYFDDGSGNLVTDRFISFNNGWYYADSNGALVKGLQRVRHQTLYFDNTGMQIKGAIVTLNGHKMYFDENSGELSQGKFVLFDGNVYYADDNGYLVTGYQNINGKNLYFNSDGVQVKDQFINVSGENVYFNGKDGSEVMNDFIIHDGKEYYADNQGYLVTGYQLINGQHMYFNEDGSQIKDVIVNLNGKLMYFDKDTGAQVSNRFVLYNGNVFYANNDGNLVTGYQHISDHYLYFNSDGTQVKGQFVKINNEDKYFNELDGYQVTNNFVFNDGKIYYLDAEGLKVTGYQQIDGQEMYFDNNGIQEKGKFVNINGKNLYLDGQSGAVVSDRFIINDGNVYYAGDDGQLVKGVQRIQNHQLLFDQNGVQEKGKYVFNDDGTISYYDAKDGYLVTSDMNVDGSTIHFNSNGQMNMPQYFITINGKTYHLDGNNKTTKGLIVINGDKYFFDENGVMKQNQYVVVGGITYHAGILTTISNETNGLSTGNGTQTSSSANSNAASDKEQSSSSAQSSSASHEVQSSSNAQSSSASHDEQASSSAQSSSASHGEQASSIAQSSSVSHEAQSSSNAQSSASSHNEQSSSIAQSSSASHDEQASSSVQSSSASHDEQASSSAQSSSASHDEQSSSSAQSSSASHEVQSSSNAQSSSSRHEVQSSSNAQSSSSSHGEQASSSAQSSSASHDEQASSIAQSSSVSHEAQSSSNAQSSSVSHGEQAISSAQSSSASDKEQSSSSAQSSSARHEAQSSSNAQSSSESHGEQASSSAQSSSASHDEQASSSAQSSSVSHEAQSSSNAQSSSSSHEAQANSSAPNSAASHESQTSSLSHGEQGKTIAHENGNGVSQNKPSQSHANDDSDKVLSNRELTTNNRVSNDHSVNNQTTQHVSDVNTLSRTQTRENQKIQSKMLTAKSLKQVNKQVSSQEKLVKKELKQLDKLKAELKKHSSKKIKKEYNALLQKYKANKKYYLALVAEENTVEKYLKSAKNLKKDQKALNSLNKKIDKDKKELKHHSSKKLKKTYEKDMKDEKKLTKAIKKYKGDEAKMKKSIVNNFKKASSMKNKKK